MNDTMLYDDRLILECNLLSAYPKIMDFYSETFPLFFRLFLRATFTIFASLLTIVNFTHYAQYIQEDFRR